MTDSGLCEIPHGYMYPSDKCVFAGRSPSATRWHGSRCDPCESRQLYDPADVHFLPSFFLALALALLSFFPLRFCVPKKFLSCSGPGETFFGSSQQSHEAKSSQRMSENDRNPLCIKKRVTCETRFPFLSCVVTKGSRDL